MTHLFVPTIFNEMSELSSYKFSLYEVFHLLFFSFLKSIELVSYYYYKNSDYVQFLTIYNFIFYKYGRSAELQKSANETLYVSFWNKIVTQTQ